jgi:hypothetical protein
MIIEFTTQKEQEHLRYRNALRGILKTVYPGKWPPQKAIHFFFV